MKTISVHVLLGSRLLSEEEAHPLRKRLQSQESVTAAEILELDLPARVRVDALLRDEFLGERALRRLACDFAGHTLHIYAAREPYEESVRRCLAAAQTYAETGAGLRELKAAVKEAIPAVWRLADTPSVGAFEAGMVVTFLDYKHAAELARIVAAHTRRAAHRRAWECRKSDVEPMTAGEEEACWQLRQVIRE